MNTNKLNKTAAKIFFCDDVRSLLNRIADEEIHAMPVKKHRDKNGNSYCEAEAFTVNAAGSKRWIGFTGSRLGFRSANPAHLVAYAPTMSELHSEAEARDLVIAGLRNRLEKLAHGMGRDIARDVDYIFACECGGHQETRVKAAARYLSVVAMDCAA